MHSIEKVAKDILTGSPSSDYAAASVQSIKKVASFTFGTPGIDEPLIGIFRKVYYFSERKAVFRYVAANGFLLSVWDIALATGNYGIKVLEFASAHGHFPSCD